MQVKITNILVIIALFCILALHLRESKVEGDNGGDFQRNDDRVGRTGRSGFGESNSNSRSYLHNGRLPSILQWRVISSNGGTNTIGAGGEHRHSYLVLTNKELK